MSLATTRAIALSGIKGEVVTVEVDISDGLPGFSLLGLPDTTLVESRERVRAAILNSSQNWPNRKVTISLLPAWLPKSGSSFDLPIAMAILAAAEPIADISQIVFIGELSLEGNLRNTRGVLPSLITAYQNGIRQAVIPSANFAEAALIPEIEIFAFEKLSQILHCIFVAYSSSSPLSLVLCVLSLDYTDDPESNVLPGDVNMNKLRGMYLSRRLRRVEDDGTVVERTELLLR